MLHCIKRLSETKCDQGTNFIAAKNELNTALQKVDPKRLTTFLSSKQCDFVLNAPQASHAGGVWERQIKTVRNVLNFTLSLSSGILSDASLRTVLYEVMAIVNSRPLTVDNLNDPCSLEPLIPNHLITVKTILALPPPGKFTKEDLYAQKRWRQVQYLTEQFWSRWKKEYLHNITVRQWWHTPKKNIQVADIVIDSDEMLPRTEWKLGRVTGLLFCYFLCAWKFILKRQEREKNRKKRRSKKNNRLHKRDKTTKKTLVGCLAPVNAGHKLLHWFVK